MPGPLPLLPPRYEAVRRLGKGGGGEVWEVEDRVSGRRLALKALSAEAGAAERTALVREAMALSGLEGLGLPRVIGFGALPDGRRYLVRELAPGESLEEVLERGDGRVPGGAGRGERSSPSCTARASSTAT